MQLNFQETERRARKMTDEALAWSRSDCMEAGRAAFALAEAGCMVSKDQGYYTDEASVYAAEMRRRAALTK